MIHPFFTLKNTIKILLGLISLVIIFHVLILLHVIPYEITWGGKLQNAQEMYVFETISILINLLLGFMLMMKGRLIRFHINERIINIVLWVFLLIFALNTVGNLFAATHFEKTFSLLTLAFALLIWRVLRIKPVKGETR